MKRGIRRTALIAFSGLLFFACTNKNNMSIQGKFENGANKTFLLQKMYPNEIRTVDTIKINATNEFQYKAKIEEAGFYVLKAENNQLITLIILPKDNIVLNGNYKSLRNYVVEGSAESILAKELNDKLFITNQQIDSVSMLYRGNHHIDELERVRSEANARYNEVLNLHHQYVTDFIDENKNSLVSLMALYQQYDKDTYVLNSEEDFQYFVMVDSCLMAEFPEVNMVRSLHEGVKELRQQLKMKAQTEAAFEIGTDAPEIALPSPEGDTIKLSSLRGKYVLLDFWASWCEPCRLENPNLVSAYKKFHEQGFEIYQVSLDRSRNAWLKAIEDDKLEWVHVSDLQFWSSAAAKTYKVESIPANYLINPEGKIAAKNMRGEVLHNTVEWFLENVPAQK